MERLPGVAMMTKGRLRLACCLMLSVCLAAGGLAGQPLVAGSASAAGSSAPPAPARAPRPTVRPSTGKASPWYWQNPTPHPYSITAVACASITRCVAVGGNGTTVRTTDAGRHWTATTLGAALWLNAVSCPSSVVCYALGQTSTSGTDCCTPRLLKSSDGGVSWRKIPLSVTVDPSALTCPDATTCLVSVNRSDGEHLFRTADSGRTWNDVFRAGHTIGTPAVPVSCPSSRVCYAGSDVLPPAATGPYDWTHQVYRSEDGGKTWTQWWQSAEDSGAGVGLLACSSSGRCLVGLVPHVFAYASLLLVQKDGKAWERIDHGAPHRLSSVTCLDGTACLVFGGKVMQSPDGGKTWSTRPLSVTLRGSVVCPASRTCYAAALYTVVKTTDGFGHTAQTPAVSRIGRVFLGSILCPTASTCYATGSGYGPSGTTLVATTNSGHTWTIKPNMPAPLRLTCPGPTVCYGIYASSPTQSVLYRTHDGARTWQRLTLPARIESPTSPGCPTVETCYIGAERDDTTTTSSGLPLVSPRFVTLVTHDGGATWSVKRAIDRVPGHSTGHPACYGGCGIDWGSLGTPSCPSVTTCLETVPTWASTGSGWSGWATGTVVAATRDGGTSWTVTAQCPVSGALPYPTAFCGPVTCPTTASCYLPAVRASRSPATTPRIPVPAAAETPAPSPTVPAPPPPSAASELEVLATHNGGATWRSVVLGGPSNFTAITCATARACSVLAPANGPTSTSIFATADGGTTWRKQALPADVASLACPGAGTCYAVGGMDILTTRPR